MKRIAILSICIVIFTGCGKVYHSSTGRSGQQFEMDKARCMNFANGAYGWLKSILKRLNSVC